MSRRYRRAIVPAATAFVLAISATATAQAARPQWRFDSSPSPAYGVLMSVTAPAKNAAWAVGTAGKTTTGPLTGYFLTWNGKRWR
jgi:hypothetical protein